jgi:hypothetical protein
MKLGEGLFFCRRNQFAAAQRTGIHGTVLHTSNEDGMLPAFNGLDGPDSPLNFLPESFPAQDACPSTNPLNQPVFPALVCHRNRVSGQAGGKASDQF